MGLGWGESREQGWHVPPALSGCVVAVLMDNPLHSSKTLACNAYLPPHDALWRERMFIANAIGFEVFLRALSCPCTGQARIRI